MVTISFNTLVGSMTNLLNDNLTDPISSTRVGSFFFDGDKDIFFTKHMPKGQVTEDTYGTDNIGFGKTYERDNTYRINVLFFSKKGDTDPTTGLKDRALVWHYLELIQTTLIGSQNSFGQSVITFDTAERPLYLPDQKIFIGTLPVVFKTRAC